MHGTFKLREHWPWLVAAAAILALLVALGPILMPFVVGAILAYLGDPIVDWLERRGLSRTLGVCLVFALLTLGLLIFIAVIAPLIQAQIGRLVTGFPAAIAWLQEVFLPKLGVKLPNNLRFDIPTIQRWLSGHWDTAGAAASMVAQSSLRVMLTIANLALIPVVSFYLLRDWDRLIAWFDEITPARKQPFVRRMARECDDVLGSFMRGQMLVMAALALYYALALWAVGLELALLVALVAGLLSFVPYLGFIVGFGLAIIAMLMQQAELIPVLMVAAVFLFGQVLEGNVFTPLLVGDKIGLHPVAVIFAVMAGGQLFGFTGVLVALPVAAILAVGLRELERRWRESHLYRHPVPEPAPSLIELPPDVDTSGPSPMP